MVCLLWRAAAVLGDCGVLLLLLFVGLKSSRLAPAVIAAVARLTKPVQTIWA
jgi:hypothetical protein